MPLFILIIIVVSLMKFTVSESVNEDMEPNSGIMSFDYSVPKHRNYTEKKTKWNFNKSLTRSEYLKIKLAKMEVAFRSHKWNDSLCSVEIRMDGHNICDFKEGTCFIFVTDDTFCKDRSIISIDCTTVFWKYDGANFNIRVSSNLYRNPRKFTMEYSYGTCVSKTTGNLTETAKPATMSTEVLSNRFSKGPTTSRPLVECSPSNSTNSEAHKRTTVILILGILLGTAMSALLAIITRFLMDKQYKKEVLTEESTYAVVFRPNDENADSGAERNQNASSPVDRPSPEEGAGENDERQIVINELYTLQFPDGSSVR